METGRLLPKMLRKQVYWYRRAAEQGYANAQSNLGYMYDAGKGVTQDYKEAVRWFRKAVEQGYANAQSNLGYMYYAGKGDLLKIMRMRFIGIEKQQSKDMRMPNLI